jgi:hypothetical protein
VRQVQVFGIARPTRYMVLEDKCVPMLEDSVRGFSHLSLMHEGRIIADRSIVQTSGSLTDLELGECGEKPCQDT